MGRKTKLISDISRKHFKSKYLGTKIVKKEPTISNRSPSISQIFMNNGFITEPINDTYINSNQSVEMAKIESENCNLINFSKNVKQKVSTINLVSKCASMPIENVATLSNEIIPNSEVLTEKIDMKNTDSRVTNHIIRGLRLIALKKNLPRTALNEVLKLLKPIFPNIPVDYRTILATPRKTNVRKVIPGRYVHFGLKSGLEFKFKQLQKKNHNIKLDFFIDGVSIHPTSKNKTFWIILARIYGADNSIIPIGLYNGPRKPDDFDDFLKPFVVELKSILNVGIDFDNSKIFVDINNFCLDTPARSSTCGTISHAGYRSCVRCLCEGTREDGRILFKYSDIKRTDLMFKERADLRFHTRDSLIEKELKINMISQFPLDFLHVVCLGITRKIFKKLVGPEKPLFPKSRVEIDKILERINETLPTEIHRSFRDIKDVSTFKGHEWRSILLKIAPVLFKSTLPKSFWKHFLLLTCAFSILCDSEMCIKYNRIANRMLKEFNEKIEDLYDESMYVPMVHQCIHFADEVLIQQTPCDKFSTWEFESYMTPIKDFIHGPRLPLSQIYKRISEYFNCPDSLVTQKNICDKGKDFLYHQGIRFDIKNSRDRFFLTKQKEVIVMLKILNFEKCQFLCRKLKKIEEYFLIPIVASKLNFFHTSTQYEGHKYSITLSQIERKLMCIVTEENNLFFAPLSKFT